VRDHGGLVFITLRDRYGFTQVVVEPGASQSAAECARGIHRESVLRVRGKVSHRPEGTWNNAIATGRVEVIASDIEIMSDAAPILPVDVSEDKLANEEARLRYRYIDLRRHSLQANMHARHRAALAVRNWLETQDFIEIQTPLFVRSTPEGRETSSCPAGIFRVCSTRFLRALSCTSNC